jgi:hypothetical protein
LQFETSTINSTEAGSATLRRRGGRGSEARGSVENRSGSSSAREAVEHVEELENKPVMEDVGNLVSELKHTASALQQEVKAADTYFEQVR